MLLVRERLPQMVRKEQALPVKVAEMCCVAESCMCGGGRGVLFILYLHVSARKHQRMYSSWLSLIRWCFWQWRR